MGGVSSSEGAAGRDASTKRVDPSDVLWQRPPVRKPQHWEHNDWPWYYPNPSPLVAPSDASQQGSGKDTHERPGGPKAFIPPPPLPPPPAWTAEQHKQRLEQQALQRTLALTRQQQQQQQRSTASTRSGGAATGVTVRHPANANGHVASLLSTKRSPRGSSNELNSSTANSAAVALSSTKEDDDVSSCRSDRSLAAQVTISTPVAHAGLQSSTRMLGHAHSMHAQATAPLQPLLTLGPTPQSLGLVNDLPLQQIGFYNGLHGQQGSMGAIASAAHQHSSTSPTPASSSPANAAASPYMNGTGPAVPSAGISKAAEESAQPSTISSCTLSAASSNHTSDGGRCGGCTAGHTTACLQSSGLDSNGAARGSSGHEVSAPSVPAPLSEALCPSMQVCERDAPSFDRPNPSYGSDVSLLGYSPTSCQEVTGALQSVQVQTGAPRNSSCLAHLCSPSSVKALGVSSAAAGGALQAAAARKQAASVATALASASDRASSRLKQQGRDGQGRTGSALAGQVSVDAQQQQQWEGEEEVEACPERYANLAWQYRFRKRWNATHQAMPSEPVPLIEPDLIQFMDCSWHAHSCLKGASPPRRPPSSAAAAVPSARLPRNSLSGRTRAPSLPPNHSNSLVRAFLSGHETPPPQHLSLFMACPGEAAAMAMAALEREEHQLQLQKAPKTWSFGLRPLGATAGAGADSAAAHAGLTFHRGAPPADSSAHHTPAIPSSHPKHANGHVNGYASGSSYHPHAAQRQKEQHALQQQQQQQRSDAPAQSHATGPGYRPHAKLPPPQYHQQVGPASDWVACSEAVAPVPEDAELQPPAWVGSLLPPARLDLDGRVTYIIAQIQDGLAGHSATVLRGRMRGCAAQVVEELKAEVAGAAMRHGLPLQAAVILLAEGTLEIHGTRIGIRCNSCSTAPPHSPLRTSSGQVLGQRPSASGGQQRQNDGQSGYGHLPGSSCPGGNWSSSDGGRTSMTGQLEVGSGGFGGGETLSSAFAALSGSSFGGACPASPALMGAGGGHRTGAVASFACMEDACALTARMLLDALPYTYRIEVLPPPAPPMAPSAPMPEQQQAILLQSRTSGSGVGLGGQYDRYEAQQSLSKDSSSHGGSSGSKISPENGIGIMSRGGSTGSVKGSVGTWGVASPALPLGVHASWRHPNAPPPASSAVDGSWGSGVRGSASRS